MKPVPATAPAIVTGASSGFGAAIVRRLAGEGRPVVAVARRQERLQELATSIGKGLVLPLVLDVRDADAVAEALGNLPGHWTDVGILVNNAGLSKGFGPVQDCQLQHWREMVDTNVMGMLHCARAILPRLIAAGRGHLINIGSIAAIYPYLGSNVYGATKAFVHQLSLNLRTDLDGTGVRVTCIAPGMAQTEFSLVRFDWDRSLADAIYNGVSALTPEDIADTVHWCISRPPRVNINTIELMPTDQPFGLGFRVGTNTSKD
jgi:3-hydroxy acid dehydrogenase / malonic semialdehyde reductase